MKQSNPLFLLVVCMLAMCSLMSSCITSTPPQTTESPDSAIAAFSTTLSSTASSADNESTPTIALAERAQQLADTIVEYYGAASVQYALLDHGTIVLSGNSGVFSKTGRRSISKDDIYGIGSVSKVFVTASVLSLQEQGLIDIDTPLVVSMPEFTMADERYRDITPRMLMTHTSGFSGTHFGNTALFDDPDTDTHDNLLGYLADQKLKHAPGEISQYCNDGFLLLELLVERISGMSYSEFLSSTFFQKLGMNGTKTSQDSFDKDTRLARTYSPIFDGELPHDTVNAIGTGGIYSTAEDLCRFADMLMGNHPDVFSKQSALMMQSEQQAQYMWSDQPNGGMFARGLGWDIANPYPFVEHQVKAVKKDGDTMLFHSALVTLPEYGLAMAVVTSGGASSGVNTAFAEHLLQQVLLDRGIIDTIITTTIVDTGDPKTMPADLERYSGLYANAGLKVVVSVRNDILSCSVADFDEHMDYLYVGDGLFASEAANEYAEFVEQPDGTIFLHMRTFNIFPGVGQTNEKSLSLQKLDCPEVSPQAAAAWKARTGKKFYLISEKPSSQMYFIPGFLLTLRLNDDITDGYVLGSAAITDETHATSMVKLRDVNNLVMWERNGTRYMTQEDRTYIQEDDIPNLSDMDGTCTIADDGFAVYYAIDADTQEKTLEVNVPQRASYAVYDANDICINFTTVSKNPATVLPEGGKIVCIGVPGDVFTLVWK